MSNTQSIIRTTTGRAHVAIADRRDFTTSGALRGENVPEDWSSYGERLGHLPAGGWSDRIRRERPTYVVFSYATPIAWWSERHGWSRPDVSYSVTTSKHQGQCPRHESID